MTDTRLNRDREREAWISPFSAGRRGPGRRDGPFTAAEIAQIHRTVRRGREVLVKVTGGGTSRRAVAGHLRYITRGGKVGGETDYAEPLRSLGDRDQFLRELHLDLSRGSARARTGPDNSWEGRKPSKLVYHIVLGMPAATAPDSVLAASRDFARENFGAQYRYAMVLHTDQAHPHVHLIVKAEDETGRRLRIDKATLRDWRAQFAQQLRSRGIAANASSRYARGQNARRRSNGAYRALHHGRSWASQAKAQSVADELVRSRRISDPVHAQLERKRAVLQRAWQDVATRLDAQGEIELAGDVRYFAARLPPVLTEREAMGAYLVQKWQEREAATRAPPEALPPTHKRERGDDFTR